MVGKYKAVPRNAKMLIVNTLILSIDNMDGLDLVVGFDVRFEKTIVCLAMGRMAGNVDQQEHIHSEIRLHTTFSRN